MMIRKWLTTMLAVLLAVMLPMCAMADTQHTLSIIPGEEVAKIGALADFLNVFQVRLTQGKNGGALGLLLSGEEIVSFAGSADATGLFFQTALLSDDVLYVTWDDAAAILSQLAATQMEAEEAEAFQQAMQEAKQQIVGALQGGVAAQPAVAVDATPEEVMAAMSEVFGDDPAMLEYLQTIANKLIAEEGEFADEKRDTADAKQTVHMAKEDFVKVLDTNYMRQAYAQIIATEEPDLSEEELSKKVDDLLAEVREVFENMEIEMDVIVYTANEEIVGMEMNLPMTMEVAEEDGNQQEKVEMTMALRYDRLTDDNGVSHQADMTVDAEEVALNFAFDLYECVDGTNEGMLAFLADGTQATVLFNAADQDDARVRSAAVYLRHGANAIIAPAASERPEITFQLVSETADPAVLSKIENADSSNAVNVMKMSAEELNALLANVETRGMQIVAMAITKLPSSVLMFLMGGGNVQ